ncbi:MAG: DUF4225 domain-containing protein [Serratia proteamaculans]
MYLAVPPGQKTIAWSEMALDREARKLVNIANTVASSHLKDGLTRIKFVEEIRDLVTLQLTRVRKSKTIEAYTQATQTLRTETNNLLEQDRLIRTKAAQLYAKIEFVRENNSIVGYVISSINVVLAGVEIFTGAVLVGTSTPIGVLAGAILFADGFNTISKEFDHYFRDKQNSEGVLANGAMSAAEFMGFSRADGLGVFKVVALTANVYSIIGLIKRPGTWRLFHHLPSDFYRKVSSMSKPALTMKIVGYGLKAKIVFDLLTTEHPGN